MTAESNGSERARYAVFIAISFVVVTAATLQTALRPELYEPYFRGIRPAFALAAIGIFGWVALWFLDRGGTFRLYRVSKARGVAAAVGLAVPFMISATVADLVGRFPEAVNVLLPAALLFYPVMGYVVELLFHAIPLALLLPATASFLRSWPAERRIGLCIALAAMLEPIFQALTSTSDAPLTLFVLVQVFVFGLVELWLFRQYDFVAMYAFRLTYYAYWHVLWGYLRLGWLF